MAYYDLHNLRDFFNPDQVITKRVEAGETLFYEGNVARMIYFVVSGEVRAEVILEDGQSVIFHRARAGNSICEENLGLPNYLYSGIASIPSVVTSVSKFDLLDKMKSNWEFTKHLTMCIAERYADVLMLRELLAIKSAAGRLRTWLHWQNTK